MISLNPGNINLSCDTIPPMRKKLFATIIQYGKGLIDRVKSTFFLNRLLIFFHRLPVLLGKISQGQGLLKSMKPKLLILKTDSSLPDIEVDWSNECEIKTTTELSHHKILPLLVTEKPQVLIVNSDGSSLKTLSLCSKIRQYFEGPIIVIAPDNNTEYKNSLLDCGADDFLSAPVAGQILADRIKHFSMKTDVSKVAIPPDNQKPTLQIGNILLDKTKRVVFIDNREINLTASEFDLLWLLATCKNRIVSRESLYQVLLKTEYDGLDRCIDNRISRLKRKLQDNRINPQLIKSVRSEGYILVEE